MEIDRGGSDNFLSRRSNPHSWFLRLSLSNRQNLRVYFKNRPGLSYLSTIPTQEVDRELFSSYFVLGTSDLMNLQFYKLLGVFLLLLHELAVIAAWCLMCRFLDEVKCLDEVKV